MYAPDGLRAPRCDLPTSVVQPDNASGVVNVTSPMQRCREELPRVQFKVRLYAEDTSKPMPEGCGGPEFADPPSICQIHELLTDCHKRSAHQPLGGSLLMNK